MNIQQREARAHLLECLVYMLLACFPGGIAEGYPLLPWIYCAQVPSTVTKGALEPLHDCASVETL